MWMAIEQAIADAVVSKLLHPRPTRDPRKDGETSPKQGRSMARPPLAVHIHMPLGSEVFTGSPHGVFAFCCHRRAQASTEGLFAISTRKLELL